MCRQGIEQTKMTVGRALSIRPKFPFQNFLDAGNKWYGYGTVFVSRKSGNSRLKIKLNANFQEKCSKNWVYLRRLTSFSEIMVIHKFLIKLTRVQTRPYTTAKLMMFKSSKSLRFCRSTASSFSIQYQFFWLQLQ